MLPVILAVALSCPVRSIVANVAQVAQRNWDEVALAELSNQSRVPLQPNDCEGAAPHRAFVRWHLVIDGVCRCCETFIFREATSDNATRLATLSVTLTAEDQADGAAIVAQILSAVRRPMRESVRTGEFEYSDSWTIDRRIRRITVVLRKEDVGWRVFLSLDEDPIEP